MLRRAAAVCVCADALVSDERAEAARAQAAEEAEAAFQRECTFTPALDTVSKKLAELSQPRYTHAPRRGCRVLPSRSVAES